MATTDYKRGEMDIQAQKSTWDAFMAGSVWGSMIIGLILLYTVLAIPLGMNWMVALGLSAVAGFAGGAFMGMGGRWIAAMIGLIGVALFVQFMIFVFGAFL